MLIAAGCQSTTDGESRLAAKKTSPKIDPETIIYSPGFIMRYKDILDHEEKRVAWELARNDALAIKQDKHTDYEQRGDSIKKQQEMSLIGKLYAPLRTADYVSGIIKFEGDDLYDDPLKLKRFTQSLYQSRIIPAFDKIEQEFSMKYQCVFNCEGNENARIYEFTHIETHTTSKYNDLPNKVYASVCVTKQKKVHELSSPLYDKNKKALYTNHKDGLNIVFNVQTEQNLAFDNNALERITLFNPACVKPANSIDATDFVMGRDLYRSISKSIPEYYATLSFSNQLALYNGNIWMLKDIDDAKLFHGIKTIN
jgi:hypothetical protein